MGHLKKRIERAIADSGESPLFSLEHFLCYPAALYARVVKFRAFLFKTGALRSEKLPCLVISIGNITVGGTGKTPMTVYTAELIRRLGYKVVVVSRGYGGKLSKEGGIVSDGTDVLVGPDMAGDEPYMMAVRLKGVPVVVGSSRYRAGMKAVERFSPDVILLDDGFQHLKLKRDLDILLMDSNRPLGNGHLLPRGTLREPVSSLSRADLLLFTRCAPDFVSAKALEKVVSDSEPGKGTVSAPVFATSHKPYIFKYVKNGEIEEKNREDGKFLRGRRVFVFSGIAKNHDFRHTVETYGCEIIDYLEFSDHHDYSDEDLENVKKQALKSGAQLILTTEKDYVRMAGRTAWPVPLVVIGVEITFNEGEERFANIIINSLRRQKSPEAWFICRLDGCGGC